jgi:hypothetical protein
MQKKVEFTPPKDFMLPEGAYNDGFDLVCTFEVNGNKLCMTKLGDTAMPGYDGKDESKHKPDYSGMAQSMVADSPNPTGGGY